jgi:hypothetical protein
MQHHVLLNGLTFKQYSRNVPSANAFLQLASGPAYFLTQIQFQDARIKPGSYFVVRDCKNPTAHNKSLLVLARRIVFTRAVNKAKCFLPSLIRD